MPLKALLNNLVVHSFEYGSEEWKCLKSSPDKLNLFMPCCESRAIPKTSILGTQYFAHSKKGECSTAPESKEHLYLKYCIAQIAKQNGWKVATEYSGQTPNGEIWVADVFCQKGNKKLVFEIQWSYQSLDEYKRRNQKYKASGVRCAWLYRIKGDYSVTADEKNESYDLPFFGFKNEADNSYIVQRYKLPIDDFVRGMLTGDLQWCPQDKNRYFAQVQFSETICKDCGNPRGKIRDLCFYNGGVLLKHLNGEKFIDIWNKKTELIAREIDKNELQNRGIGEPRLGVVPFFRTGHIHYKKGVRYKTLGYKGISFTCSYCGNNIGSFDLSCSIKDSHWFEVRKEDIEGFNFKAGWVYKGKFNAWNDFSF